MNTPVKQTLGFAIAVSCIALCPALRAQQEGPVPTTATVHIEAKGKPVDASMLTLELRGKKIPIDSLTPASPNGIELAVLIDDGLRHSIALQYKDVETFIGSLPPSVKVMIGYMSNGSVMHQTGFESDHAAVQQQLRIPFSTPGQSASPYLCLSDFVKSWPSNSHAARVVLMITNGVDPYNGSTSILNQDSPYVEAAGNDAMRAGVAVYAMYYGDAGMHGGSANFSGQSYLAQLTDTTGGESLYQGTMNPVDFTPFLTHLRNDLAETYILAFQADVTHEKQDTLVPMRVKSTVSGIKVHAPQAVHPGVDE